MIKVLGIATVVMVLSGAAYFGNEALTCSRLEDDYLNSVASIRSTELTASLISNPELDSLMDEQRRLYNLRVEQAMAALYTRCGERRWQTAHRKAYDMVLDW